MQTYRDLADLARICIKQSRIATPAEAGAQLMRLAKECQRQAAALDGGRLPDIGEDQIELHEDASPAPDRT